MKQDQHTTFTGSRTTGTDLCRWAQTLFHLHSRLAPRFARPEPRRRALAWSWWRRRHQYRASFSHRKRRLKAS